MLTKGIRVAAMALLLAACALPAGTSSGGTSPSRSFVPAPSNASAGDESESASGDVPNAILEAILADAAERAGAERDAVEVIEASAVTWNDGSLGCPELGQAYTQALVDGYQVVVMVAGERLDYRVGSGGGFRVCETPGAGG